jgi:hypothetical protein
MPEGLEQDHAHKVRKGSQRKEKPDDLTQRRSAAKPQGKTAEPHETAEARRTRRKRERMNHQGSHGNLRIFTPKSFSRSLESLRLLP